MLIWMMMMLMNIINGSPGQYDHYQYPECDVPVPGIFNFFGGIETSIGTNWYRKEVSEKFGTGKKSRNWYQNFFDTGTVLRCQNLGISKIYNGYR